MASARIRWEPDTQAGGDELRAGFDLRRKGLEVGSSSRRSEASTVVRDEERRKACEGSEAGRSSEREVCEEKESTESSFGSHFINEGKGDLEASYARWRSDVSELSQRNDYCRHSGMRLEKYFGMGNDRIWLQIISVGFMKGGEAHNVIPESVTFGGTFRSMTTEGLYVLQRRIREVIEAQAAVHRCTATIKLMDKAYPATTNDEKLFKLVRGVGVGLVGEANVHPFPRLMGAEDFSFFSQRMPAVLFTVGIRNESIGSIHTTHSPYFIIDEEVLPLGAAFHAAVALTYIDREPFEL